MAEEQNPQVVPPQEPPGGSMSYDEFRQAVQSGTEDPERKAQQQEPAPHPVRGFFDRLVNGEDGKGFTMDRAKDILRSGARGVSNMVNETVNTLGEGEAYAIRKTGLGDDQFNKEYDQKGDRQFTKDRVNAAGLQIPTDEVFGKRSDDLLAGFTEDTAQFVSSFEMLDLGAAGKLGELKGAVGFASRAVRGAVTEFSAFDPHSGSLAGLIAKIPVPGVKNIGQALMEKPDDTELVARMKRAASGMIPGMVIDGLVEGIRGLAAAKKIRAGATGEELTSAEQTLKKAQKVHQQIAEGTYTPDDAHVVARPTEDGNWILKTVKSLTEDDSAPAAERDAAKTAEREAKTIKPQGAPLDPAALAETQPLFDTLKDPNATPEAKAEAQRKIDDLGAQGSQPYEDFKRGDPLPESVKQRMFPESPVYKDRAEAEQQAETINNGMNERLQAARNAGGLTREQSQSLRETFKQMINAPTKEDLQGLVEGTHFNFSYYNTTDETLSMIESVSKKWREEIDAAQKTGGVSEDRHLELVQELMGRVPKADHPAYLTDALTNGSPVERSVLMSAGDLVMREYAQKASKLFDVLEQRPHDEIAQLEAQHAANALVNLQTALAGANSETGRALRFLQSRDKFAGAVGEDGLPGAKGEAEAPKAAEAEAPKVKPETVKKATDAKKAIADVKEEMVGVGPNTFTVADEADVLDMAKSRSKENEDGVDKTPVAPDVEEQGLNDGTKDSQGANASDFQKARQRQKAISALMRAKDALEELGEKPQFDPEVLADNRSLRGERVKMQADLQRSEPLEAPDVEAPKGPQNPIENLSKMLDQAESQLDAAMERAQKAQEPKAQGQKLPEDVSPVSTYIKQPLPGKPVAGMPTRIIKDPQEVRTILRVAKLANGDVNALYAVGKTASVIREGGLLKGAMEVGINSMLSGIPTAATVHIMGTATTMYNALTKMIGSAVAMSPDGMREGLDMLIANERFAVDNLKVARMAGIEGRSIVNPTDVHEVIPGAIGDFVRAPSKVLTASEEFTRVTNYRSEVYAKSLRYWRGQGLDGPDLSRQVAKDLDAAFTQDGVARLPGPLARADATTFRQQLQPGSFGSDLNNFMNKRFVTKLIAPFVRTSINMSRWQFERTPILNTFLENSRGILLGKQGAEAAGQLWTQTAVSGWLAYYAYTHAAADNLTGRGPANPTTRQLWLQDHKPYSMKIDGKWVTYNRGDPLLQPLAIFSDIYQIAHEVSDDPKYHAKTSDVLFASVAGLAAALGDKTYMRSMTDFFEAWSGGKSEMLKKWAYGEGASLVPYGNMMRSLNPDPYLHEVESFKDELMAEIPGLSEHLPAKYDLYGEPQMKSQSTFPFKVAGSAQPDVGSELMKLNRAFAPINKKQLDGLPIDLTDREKFNDGKEGMSPYERAMELLREPKHGQPMKDQLRALVQSPEYQKASGGSVEYPGGRRYQMAASVIQSNQRRALEQVQHEYKSLRNEVALQRQAKGASEMRGQEGVASVLAKAGR